ncbi:MAG TPA: hypothetical protein VM103_00855, partial [Candidatus Paceibacterota bacterium]|nr:hypothetical protein [Candidatus Paceibacterota bacterium]
MKTLTVFVLALAFLVPSTVVFAEDAPATTTPPGTAMEKLRAKGNEAIDERIAKLNAVFVRIDTIKNLRPADKTALKAKLSEQIKAMNDLKAKIAADTTYAAVKADVQSITKSYRIYAVVVPKATIIAAADRILSVYTSLGMRVAALRATAGASNTEMTVRAIELQGRLETVRNSANEAKTTVENLAPDLGVLELFNANKQTVLDARAKLQAAQNQLGTIRA